MKMEEWFVALSAEGLIPYRLPHRHIQRGPLLLQARALSILQVLRPFSAYGWIAD